MDILLLSTYINSVPEKSLPYNTRAMRIIRIACLNTTPIVFFIFSPQKLEEVILLKKAEYYCCS